MNKKKNSTNQIDFSQYGPEPRINMEISDKEDDNQKYIQNLIKERKKEIIANFKEEKEKLIGNKRKSDSVLVPAIKTKSKEAQIEISYKENQKIEIKEKNIEKEKMNKKTNIASKSLIMQTEKEERLAAIQMQMAKIQSDREKKNEEKVILTKSVKPIQVKVEKNSQEKPQKISKINLEDIYNKDFAMNEVELNVKEDVKNKQQIQVKILVFINILIFRNLKIRLLNLLMMKTLLKLQKS